jgi:hypothetical protein
VESRWNDIGYPGSYAEYIKTVGRSA